MLITASGEGEKLNNLYRGRGRGIRVKSEKRKTQKEERKMGIISREAAKKKRYCETFAVKKTKMGSRRKTLGGKVKIAGVRERGRGPSSHSCGKKKGGK